MRGIRNMKKQIELRYSFDAFEPKIDAATMETHYTKHHKGYTDNLNAIIESTPELQNRCVKSILRNLDAVPENVRAGVRNNGGGYVNHNLYFDTITPNPVSGPTGELAEKIEKTFGSVENLKAQLTDLALKQFGSGWSWLAVNEETKELAVLATPNQDNPLSQGYYPIFGIDVWEHAYYLKYKNLRKSYVDALLTLIDWEQVAKYYEKAKSSSCDSHK